GPGTCALSRMPRSSSRSQRSACESMLMDATGGWTATSHSPTAMQPTIQIVGLPDTAVQEAKERVRAAIKNSGGRFPGIRITVNLAPADLKKEGPSYDMAIAVGVLMAGGQLTPEAAEKRLFLGELGFD